jgi:hypothetical protein
VIAELVTATYGVGYLPSARWLYGRWHVQQQEKPTHLRRLCEVDHPQGYRNECCFRNKTNTHPTPDGVLAFFAIVVASLWPGLALVGLVRWNPPKSPSEKEAELTQRQEWLKEQEALLNKELGR